MKGLLHAKMWRVIGYEYTRLVMRKGFWFGMLSVPLLVVFMVGLIFMIVAMEINTTPLGYVDHSGLLQNPVPAPPTEALDQPVPMVAYPDEETAQKALDGGEIQAYYVLAYNYWQTSDVLLVYNEEPKGPAQTQFRAFIRANLLAQQDSVVTNRIVDGMHLTVRAADGSRQMNEDEWFNLLLPIFVAVTFFISLQSSSGYLMQAVVEEKENRTMEIMVTSLSTNQLMAGKIIGNLAVGLTQIVAWLLFIALGIVIGGIYIEPLRAVKVSWDLIGILVLVMLPCFVMLAGLMATIGATVTEAREGQQMSGLVAMPIWLPYFLMALIMENPNSPLAVGLTLFPITAPMTILLRIGFTVIPAWQIAISVTLLILMALGSLWLAGRAFRLGMLMYGQKLAWRQLFRRSL